LEEDPLEKTKSTSRALEFEVDSTIAIYLIRDAKERRRFLEVLKMRGTNHSNKVYSVNIGKKGFVIGNSPVSRVFN
jgi:KaiC/GvpD/RAD55 family RecA-like ATPase